MCLSSSDFYLVGVSGPYHSGKSFMLNALVNRTRSSPVPSPFEVGKTTESQTRGMWLHGGPLDRHGLDHGVVFLDCEGLAATENTEQHDEGVVRPIHRQGKTGAPDRFVVPGAGYQTVDDTPVKDPRMGSRH